MPMTYEQAKQQVVGDAPAPKVNSPEHQEILKLMKLNGWSSIGELIKAQISSPPEPVIVKPKTYEDMVNPLNIPAKVPVEKKPISKHEWMAIESNRAKFNEIINKNKNVSAK